MILFLAAVHAFIFNTPRKFLSANILGSFFLILLHLSIQILTLETHSFKLLRYTYERNCNGYKL